MSNVCKLQICMRGVLCSLWVTLRCFTTPPRAWRWGVARCSPQNFTRSRTDTRQHGSADASGQNMMLMLNTARSQGQDTTQNFTQRRWQWTEHVSHQTTSNIKSFVTLQNMVVAKSNISATARECTVIGSVRGVS